MGALVSPTCLVSPACASVRLDRAALRELVVTCKGIPGLSVAPVSGQCASPPGTACATLGGLRGLQVMADLEGATRSFAFTSGMGALAVAMRLVPSGGHIVTGDDIYGGTSRLLSRVAPDQGISVSNVDMCDSRVKVAALAAWSKCPPCQCPGSASAAPRVRARLAALGGSALPG